MCPKVPEDQPPMMSTQVPGVTFPMHQEFGKVGQGLERIGESIQNDAVQGKDIYNEVQRQEAISQADNASVQHKLWSDSYTRDLKISSPDGLIHQDGDQQQPAVQNTDGTPRTITQEFWDQSNQKYQADQDGMSPMAAAMYRQKMLPEIGARASVLNNDAYQMRLNAADQTRATSNEGVFKEFDAAPYDQTYGASRPDLNKFSDYAQSATLDLQRQGGVLDPTTGAFKGGLRNQSEIGTLQQKQLNEYGKQWMESSMTKIMEEKAGNGPHMSQDIQNLLDVVRGKDPQSVAFQQAGKITPATALSAEQRLIYEDRLLKMIPAAQSIDMSEFNLLKTNYQAAAEKGQYPLGQTNGSRDNLMSWMDAFEKSGQWNSADRIKSMSDITAAEAKGMLAGRTFDLQPQGSQHALTERAAESSLHQLQQDAQMRGMPFTADIGAQVANEVRAKGIENVNRVEAEKQRDFPGFMAGQDSFGLGKPRSGISSQVARLDWTNPAALQKSGLIQPYLNQMSKIYASNYGTNMDYWRPISKDNSMSLGAAISNMSPTQQGQAIDNLKGAYGKAFPNLMDTLIQDNALNTKTSQSIDWKFVGGIPTVQGRVAQLSAMQGTQATKELYEAQFHGDKWDDLRSRVAQAWKPDMDVLVKASPLNVDQRAYANSLLNRATNAVAQMRLQTGGSIDEAIPNSKAEAFKGYPTVETVGNHQSLFGWQTPFVKGPQVPVAFSANLSDTQKSVIKQNLGSLMTEQGLKTAGVAAPAPQPGAPDLSEHFHQMASQNITSINHVNTKDGPGYTIDYQGVNADGRPNGQVMHMMDSKGNKKFFPESDLLVPRNATTAPAPRVNLPTYQPDRGPKF